MIIMIKLTVSDETVKLEQENQILEMTSVQWRCFTEIVPLLQAFFTIMKEDITFTLCNMHLVAHIYAETDPITETVVLKDQHHSIILKEDDIEILLDNQLFVNIEPCYAAVGHNTSQCENCKTL